MLQYQQNTSPLYPPHITLLTILHSSPLLFHCYSNSKPFLISPFKCHYTIIKLLLSKLPRLNYRIMWLNKVDLF